MQWDLAESRGWGDRSSDFSLAYAEALKSCDAVVGGGYAAVRIDSRDAGDVNGMFEKVLTNYKKWGRGTNDVLMQAVDSPAAKKNKRQIKGFSDEQNRNRKHSDEGSIDVTPISNRFMMSAPPSSSTPVTCKNEKQAKNEKKAASFCANEKPAGQADASATPRKRRTGGKKGVTATLSDAKIKAKSKTGCVPS